MTDIRASAFEALAGTLMNNISLDVARSTRNRRYRACFGTSSHVCSLLWALLLPSLPGNATPLHLLWALFFLKIYSTEAHNASVANCDEKTYRKWAWKFIYAIADLDLVSVFNIELLWSCFGPP